MTILIKDNYLTIETEFSYLHLPLASLIGIDSDRNSKYIRIYSHGPPNSAFTITCHSPVEAEYTVSILRSTMKEAHGRGVPVPPLGANVN